MITFNSVFHLSNHLLGYIQFWCADNLKCNINIIFTIRRCAREPEFVQKSPPRGKQGLGEDYYLGAGELEMPIHEASWAPILAHLYSLVQRKNLPQKVWMATGRQQPRLSSSFSKPKYMQICVWHKQNYLILNVCLLHEKIQNPS